MSGQGTVGLEIVDQLEEVDAVVVPVEGGTLLAGTCVAVKTLYPSIQMIVSIVFYKIEIIITCIYWLGGPFYHHHFFRAHLERKTIQLDKNM